MIHIWFTDSGGAAGPHRLRSLPPSPPKLGHTLPIYIFLFIAAAQPASPLHSTAPRPPKSHPSSPSTTKKTTPPFNPNVLTRSSRQASLHPPFPCLRFPCLHIAKPCLVVCETGFVERSDCMFFFFCRQSMILSWLGKLRCRLLFLKNFFYMLFLFCL